MTRTERLEAALRELLDASVALEAAIHSEPDMSGHLKNIHISTVRGEAPLRRFQVVIGDAATALADTAPSCCEEVRRAALEEAAAEGKFLIPCDDRYDAGVRALAKRIRALSNQPPPFCDQPSPSGVARCELEPQHEGKHAGNAKEGNLVFWGQAPNQAPPKSPDKSGAPVPVCKTCKGKGRIVTAMEAVHAPPAPMAMIAVTASCPVCAGGGK